VNPRVVFEGPAGTGKTLLAIEEARRSALRKDRVLFCCFNRLLGAWLKNEAAPLGRQVTTAPFHRYLLELTKTPLPPAPTPSFWEDTLPEAALEKVLSAGTDFEPFDVLIVDEAQDLLKVNYVIVLDTLLRGGLANGRWRLFGDFERQSIYGSSGVAIEEALSSYAPGVPRFRLRKNCRNTPRIVSFVGLFAGFEKGYSEVLRPDSGIEPEMIYFDEPEDQDRKLVGILGQLFNDGYNGREIVILSPRAQGNAATRIVAPPWSDRLKPADSSAPGGPRYCTVHAFKGLEAPVIIVTDVKSLGTPADQSIFYTATTRAVDRLYVLASSRIKPAILDLLLHRKSSLSAA
jgi:superfamily I DNA/RNA helicase